MSTGEIIITVLLSVFLLAGVAFIFLRKPNKDISEQLDALSEQNRALSAQLEQRLMQKQDSINELVSQRIELMSSGMRERQELFSKSLEGSDIRNEERFKTFASETEQKLENIRTMLEHRLRGIQEENNLKLEDMRKTVDEKLQSTIDRKMTESFKTVNDRLEQVYKGLGEMQSLAVGVGDLKKALTNVKTRGIVGEIQLGAILEDILSPEQYEKNCRVKKGSDSVVEFAVKIPFSDDGYVYLPIDSKFPGDTYNALLDAYDSGAKAEMDAAAKLLASRIMQEAKDISSKYIYPPETTDFAIMFLPFEGLYAEVVNRGMPEELQRKYHITVAGPSTMAAMLCSMRMCFKNAAVQRYSGEVWQVLGAVKTEFAKFAQVLDKTQKKLDETSKELDELVGTRTRAINRKLKSVEEIDLKTSEILLKNEEE